MRLRRLELAVIALTVAFICFMGGYFTGRRGSVDIFTVSSQRGETMTLHAGAAPEPDSTVARASDGDTVPAGSDAEVGSGGQAAEAGQQGGASALGGEAAAQTPEAAGAPRDSDGRININTASRAELTDLPGIGDVLAGRIVEYRQQYGDFSRIEDIKNVSGIGEKKFEAMRDRITVASG